MRNHTSTIVTLLVTFSFLGVSVGCRSTGGPWYNPKSYTWKTEKQAPGSENAKALAEGKPSLGAQPNISAPPSGYTAGNFNRASQEESAKFHNTAKDNYASTAYGVTQTTDSKVAAAAPNYSGYTSAEAAAAYNPYPAGGTATQPSTPDYTYSAANSATQTAPNTTSGYGNYQQTSAVVPTQQTSGYGYNSAPAPSNSNYAPFGTASENNAGYQVQQPGSNPVNGGQQVAPSYYGTALDQQGQGANPYAAPVSGGYSQQAPAAPSSF